MDLERLGAEGGQSVCAGRLGSGHDLDHGAALETGQGAEEGARAEVVATAGSDLAADRRRHARAAGQHGHDLLGGTREPPELDERRHANAEQETVYSQVAERIGAEDIRKAEREHEEIQQLLESVKAMDIESEEWKNQLKILNDSVEAHVKYEEGEVFPKMMEKFSDAEAKTIAKQFHEAKNRELERLANGK